MGAAAGEAEEWSRVAPQQDPPPSKRWRLPRPRVSALRVSFSRSLSSRALHLRRPARLWAPLSSAG